jgi:hypothetical protein
VQYEIIELDGKKYSACEDFITGDTELVTAWHIKQLNKKDNNTSDYESLIAKAEELGIKDVRLRIDQMLTLDFIIVNVDRHYESKWQKQLKKKKKFRLKASCGIAGTRCAGQ